MATVGKFILRPPPGEPPENRSNRRPGHRYVRSSFGATLPVLSITQTEGKTCEIGNASTDAGNRRGSDASVTEPNSKVKLLPSSETNLIYALLQTGQECGVGAASATSKVMVKVRLMDQERWVSPESAAIIENLVENRR